MKEFLEELKNIHRRFSKFEFAIVLIFILLVLFIPYQPNIIGFSDTQMHKQSVNLAVESSKSFILESKEPVTITSLSVSGEVLGSGSASLYLVDKEGNKHKVFSNEQKGMSLITGFYGEETNLANTRETKDPILNIIEGSAISVIEAVANAVPGEFSGVCTDTCQLNADLTSFELIAYVEPGTKLIIEELDYTTVKK